MSSWNKDLLLVKGGMNEFIPRYKKWDDPGTWVKIPFSNQQGWVLTPSPRLLKIMGISRYPSPMPRFPPREIAGLNKGFWSPLLSLNKALSTPYFSGVALGEGKTRPMRFHHLMVLKPQRSDPTTITEMSEQKTGCWFKLHKNSRDSTKSPGSGDYNSLKGLHMNQLAW